LNDVVQRPPELDDRDVIEAQALRRRQVIDAFVQGREGRAGHWNAPARRGFLIGLAVAIVLSMVVGVVGVVQATRQQQKPQGDASPATALQVTALRLTALRLTALIVEERGR
jgi:hypothetical protein